MKNRTLATVGTFAAVVTLFAFSSVPASAQAIYTTTASGLTVNGNLYPSKADVYLTGGPQKCGPNGLPDGTYYFQVTDPSVSTLLSSDGIADRTFSVSGGTGVINGYVGAHVVSGTPGPCGSKLIQLLPFNNTPNNGGEYKLTAADASCTTVDEVSGLLVSSPSCFSKTDNFKVKEGCTGECGGTPQATVSGIKFYDGNKNGVLDPATEGPVQGVKVTVTSPGNNQVAFTDAGGNYAFVLPLNASFQICEDLAVAPFSTSLWEQIAPFNTSAGGGFATWSGGCWNGTAAGNLGDLNFGNVAKITGTKYFDTNLNGAPDNGEPTANGFKVLYCLDNGCNQPQTVLNTTASPSYTIYLPKENSTYQICEATASNWVQTGPIPPATVSGSTYKINDIDFTPSATAASTKCWSPGTGPLSGLYLTNVCLGAGGGLTLGYYSNKNGQATITADDLTFLSVSLNLRNADGTAFDPATAAILKAWLLSGNAVNMSYMLSVQLTAMQLNVRHGLVSASALIYAPGTNSANPAGFATVQAVMDEANTLLGTNGSILSGDPLRTRAEAIKNALDKANNNLNFVQTDPTKCAAPVYSQ